jgi:Arc/MetJ-type ribon-helix-helix transcriptional regulator
MKQKLSVTLDEKTLEKVDEIIKEGSFRNKSHVVEYSLNKTLKDRKNGKD